MKDLSDEDLYDERTAIVGLTLRHRMPIMSPRERTPTDQYGYPLQECSIKVGAKLFTLDEQRFGEVVAMDTTARTIDVKKLMKLDAVHPNAVSFLCQTFQGPRSSPNQFFSSGGLDCRERN